MRPGWLRKRRVKRLLAAAFGVVLAFGAGSATARFLWCAPMEQARLACCCPVEHERETWRAPCCEAQERFSHEAVQAEDNSPRIVAAAPAPLVALLEMVDREPSAHARADHSLHARAGPSERLHAIHSIYLI